MRTHNLGSVEDKSKETDDNLRVSKRRGRILCMVAWTLFQDTLLKIIIIVIQKLIISSKQLSQSIFMFK